MRRLAFLLSLTLAACGETDGTGDTGTVDTSPPSSYYICECPEELQDDEGYCTTTPSFSCGGTDPNVDICEQQCIEAEDPCCAAWWRDEA